MPKPQGLPLAEAIRFGWRTVREYPLFLFGTSILSTLIPSVIEWGGERFLNDSAEFAVQVISFLVSATLALGLAKIYLRFRDGERPIFENLFDGLTQIHKYIGANLIACVAVAMGLLLLLIPGIVILIRLWFVGFVIVDTHAGPLEALQQSWDISRRHTFDLFLLFLLLCGILLLGLICLGIGVFVALPVCGLSLAHVYRVLKPANQTLATEAA
jgi:uncharacterized membrane protein